MVTREPEDRAAGRPLLTLNGVLAILREHEHGSEFDRVRALVDYAMAQRAAALAAPPPDETREALAILDELIELAESNIGRAQRLRDNPHFVQGDRVSYAVQADVWGSLAETLKTRRAGFPPAAQAPPASDPPGLNAEARILLLELWSGLSGRRRRLLRNVRGRHYVP